MAKGGDPQLEKAVALVMEQIAKTPPVRPAKPPYPNRSGR